MVAANPSPVKVKLDSSLVATSFLGASHYSKETFSISH